MGMKGLYGIVAILIFGFLIAIHEFGHFITAKLSGIRVNEYSINMGPKLWQKKIGETMYSLRLIPIGGYCAMEGEDGDSEDPRAFTSAAWWKRLIVLCAGSFMNYLTGFVVMVLLFSFAFQMPNQPVIASFMEGSAMPEQGLEVGDQLYSINGKRIYFASDFTLLIGRVPQEQCDLTILRDGKRIELEDFRLERRELTDQEGHTAMYLGLSVGAPTPDTPGNVLRSAWYQCLDFSRLVWYGLQDLFTGRAGLQDVGGAVSVVDVMVQAGASEDTVSHGIQQVLYFGAFIAVNLAVMNMLPIPALDGGRVLFLLIGTVFTAVTKKKIDPKYEGYINAAAMILLLGLMLLLFVKDIYTIWKR